MLILLKIPLGRKRKLYLWKLEKFYSRESGGTFLRNIHKMFPPRGGEGCGWLRLQNLDVNVLYCKTSGFPMIVMLGTLSSDLIFHRRRVKICQWFSKSNHRKHRQNSAVRNKTEIF